MIGVPVRLLNLTRRKWISSLKTVKVRVVVEVGCFQRKRVMWLRTVGGKRREAQLFIPYRLTLIASHIVRKRSEDAQPFKNPSTTPLPPDRQQAYPATLPPLPQSRNMYQSIPSAEHSIW